MKKMYYFHHCNERISPLTGGKKKTYRLRGRRKKMTIEIEVDKLINKMNCNQGNWTQLFHEKKH